MTDLELRKLLRGIYGKGKFQLTKWGQINVYGKIPNTDKTGWYMRCFNDRVGRQLMIQAALENGVTL